jgi:PKD repeat protein
MTTLRCLVLLLLAAGATIPVVPTAAQKVAQVSPQVFAYKPGETSFAHAPAQGDLIVAFTTCGITMTTPPGWTKVEMGDMQTFYQVVEAGAPNRYRIACEDYEDAVFYDVSGADRYHPIDAAADSKPATGSTIVVGPITPTVKGTLALAAFGGNPSAQGRAVLTPGWTFVRPTVTPTNIYHPVVYTAYESQAARGDSQASATFALASAKPSQAPAEIVLINPAGTTPRTPTAEIGGPYSGVLYTSVGFDGSGSFDPRGAELSYLWNFGDGTTGTGSNPTHAYNSMKSYKVSLTVKNREGQTAGPVDTTVSIFRNCSAAGLGNLAPLNGFVPSPMDAWHQKVDRAPIDPMSDTIINKNGLAGNKLHPDFGPVEAGIPYTVVDSSRQPMVPIGVSDYAGQSDLSVEPIPGNMLVEGRPPNCTRDYAKIGDSHGIVFDRHTCVAYEISQANFCSHTQPNWTSNQTSIWDFTETEKRPLTWTSVDAGGLSIFEGLIRYDEIVAGVIDHAIRFTASMTRNGANGGYFVAPATHAAGNNWSTNNIMGMRIRLKASFDISGFSRTNRIILTAMKQYGMILADNGGTLYFQGTPDPRWTDSDLNALKSVHASDFEVVYEPLAASYRPGEAPMYPKGPVMDAANVPKGRAPQNSLSASATQIRPGESVTLVPLAIGASYSYIDNAGFVRGPVAVRPTTTTTYTLHSSNAFGSTASKPVTVVVTPNR